MAKTLPERFVQDAVAARLNKEYYRRKPAYVSTEVYTKLKRADVLLSFMRTSNRPYVVVVEAKSRTTIHQLKLKENRTKTQWLGRLVTIGLIVGLSAVLGYQWYFNALNTLLLLGVFVLGATLITALIDRLQLSFLGSISAIEQLGRYPANESWIAVGEDTFAKPAEYKILRRQCRKNGVGLIVVNAKGKLARKEIPRPRHVFNDYLSSYGRRKEILETIDRNPDYGATPPERRQNRRRFLNIALLLGVVFFLGLLGYEENYGPVVPDPFGDEIHATPEDTNIGDTPVEMPTDPFGEADAFEDNEAFGEDTAIPVADCSGFSVNERVFIVADAVLSPENAKVRMAILGAAGMRGHRLLPAPCLNSWPDSNRMVIWTGEFYPNRPRATEAARVYRQILTGLGVEVVYGKAVKVRP